MYLYLQVSLSSLLASSKAAVLSDINCRPLSVELTLTSDSMMLREGEGEEKRKGTRDREEVGGGERRGRRGSGGEGERG